MAAVRTVKDLSLDPEFSGYYDVEEAHKQDIEDAKIFGIEKGITQGMKQKAIETARILLNMGVNTIEQISKATNLSIEEIEKIKETMKEE